MKKFKIISSFVALALVVGLLSFGIYAASLATYNIKSKVTFEVTNVFIDVTYGNASKSESFTTMGENGTFNAPAQSYDLPATNFEEETVGQTSMYFITVENLHGQDIYVSFNSSLTNKTTHNNLTLSGGAFSTTTEDFDVDSYENNDVIVMPAHAIITYSVTITLTDIDYKASASLSMSLKASVNDFTND